MSEASAKPRSKSLQRRDAKLALKASQRYKRMQQREAAPKLTGKQRVLNWLLHIIMAMMVIYCLVPLLWVFFSATKTNEGMFSSFGLWFDDKNVFWRNVQETLAYQHGTYARWLLNTVMYAVVAGFGATIIATLAGYAIATMRFPGRNSLLAITLAFMSIPATVISVAVPHVLEDRAGRYPMGSDYSAAGHAVRTVPDDYLCANIGAYFSP